jgi:hypothetical protein
MGGRGLELGEYSHVEGVRAIRNRFGGISAGSFSRIIGNVCNSNSGDGIFCAKDCVISDNTANLNAAYV